MIEIYNLVCKVNRKSRYFSDIKELLTMTEVEKSYNYYTKKSESEVINKLLYEYEDRNTIIFPKGLLRFIPTRYKRVTMMEPDLSLFHQLNEELPKVDWTEFAETASSNPDIILRGDQLESIKRMIKSRTGILQLATGSGKSVIIAGFLKLIKTITGEQVGALILEPTQILVDSMIDTLRECGLDADPYSSSRGDLSGNKIYVTHPRSLNNDYRKDEHLLDNVRILINDETHHEMAASYSNISKWSSNLIYNFGLSASVMDSSKIFSDRLSIFTYDEAVILGIFGKILIDLPPSYYIDRGILATPLLFRIKTPANEYVKESSNWAQLRKYKLESYNRVNLISKVAAFYSTNLEFKVLILGGTKSNCTKIMEMIAKRGLSESVRCSFGGGEFLKFDLVKDKPVPDEDNSLDKFKSGEVKILVGTTHIYEGADIPSLDVVILANIGKKPRVLIQGIGRSLRKTKNGKYAHVIDFTDYMDKILNYHSRLRRDLCRSVIGIKKENIFDDIDFNMFKKLVMNLEDNK